MMSSNSSKFLVESNWRPLFISNGHVPAVEDIVGHEHMFYLAKDSSESGSKKFYPLELDEVSAIFGEILRLPEDRRVFYEYVVGVQKMHIDMDITPDIFPGLEPEFSDRAHMMFRAMIDALMALEQPLREFTGKQLFCRPEDIVVCESHRIRDNAHVDKFSWHLVLKGVYFRCHLEVLYLFEERLMPFILGNKDGEVYKAIQNGLVTEEQVKRCFDPNVYKSKQQWRMLHCAKFGVGNYKRLVRRFEINDTIGRRVMDATHSDLDTLVGRYPRIGNADDIIDLSQGSAGSLSRRGRFANVEPPLRDLRRTIDNTDEGYFRSLLELVPDEDWRNYNTWFQLIGAMWNFYKMDERDCDVRSAKFRICNEFSKRGGDAYSEAGVLNELWKCVAHPKRVGFTFVRTRAAMAAPREVAELDEYYASGPLDGSEARAAFLSKAPPYFKDITHGDDGRPRVVEHSARFLRMCQRVFAIVQGDACKLWLKKTPRGIVRTSKIESEVTVTMGKDGKKSEEIGLDAYLKRNVRYLTSFHSIDFIPYTDPREVDDPMIFNLFEGYEALKFPSPRDATCIELLLEHIKTVWCRGNLTHYEYVMRWFAWIVQKNKKTGTMLVIHSDDHGAGKSIVIDFIMKKVIGMKYSLQANDWDTITGAFNTPLLNKILTVGDELSAIA